MPGEIVAVGPPAVVYRIARRGHDPIAPPPWEMAGEDGTFGNRFDDPSAERGHGPDERFRVIYCATNAVGAFGETLAHFRPSISLLAKLRAIDDDEPLERQLTEFGAVSEDWRLRRILAATELDDGLRFVDLAAVSTHQHLRMELASDLADLSLPDLDFSTVTGPHRRLTQRCARHIYDLRDHAGVRKFAGIRYLSRLNPNWECWAIFSDRIVHVPKSPETIAPDNPDFLRVCDLFGLSVETLK